MRSSAGWIFRRCLLSTGTDFEGVEGGQALCRTQHCDRVGEKKISKVEKAIEEGVKYEIMEYECK